jgi:DNA end-binding protein Ku
VPRSSWNRTISVGLIDVPVKLYSAVESKRKGKRISAPKPEKKPPPVPELMAALDRSLAEATGGARGTDRREAATTKHALDDMSREELYARAQEQNVPGRSSMSKEQLVDSLSR